MNTRDTTLPVSLESPSLPMIHETASSAGAAKAKALVEARYIMALRRPRIWDQVRQDILKECRRPSFAHNKSAYFIKPIGDGVEGLGIRFAEVALRCMTNVTIETITVFEDGMKEIVNVTVTDLEANVPHSIDIPISKTVERRKPSDDGSYLSVRKNSWGKEVYTVIGTDEDLLNKRGALISKAIRSLTMRLIPGDIQDEAEAIIKAIRLDSAAQDPGAERKKIADAFAELSVKAKDLQEYLGHPLDNCSPQELVKLRGIYGAIRDGEATWAQVMENKAEGKDQDPPKGGDKPSVSDEDFAAALEKARAAIAKKKKTAADILATMQSKSTLTPAQIAAVTALGIDPDSTASPEAIAAMRAKAEEKAIGNADIDKHLGMKDGAIWTVALVEKALAFIADPVGASKK